MIRKHYLLIRLSAMGDVSMVLPVLKKVLAENPDTEISFLTHYSLTSLFQGIDRLRVIGVDTKKQHKGLAGIVKLFKETGKEGPYDGFLDIHDVLRSRLLGLLFSLTGIKTIRIDKGRNEKRELIRTKKLRLLQHSTERYAAVFKKAGLSYSERPFTFPSVNTTFFPASMSPFINGSGGELIGFAPFARHDTKTLPAALCHQLLKELTARSCKVLLFGGPENADSFREWEQKYEGVHSTIALSLTDQILLMTKLKAMISMDSANMHLAAIQGTPVLSIWGATDPCFGFSGIGTTKESWIITRKKLSCRPCSIFGNKPCSNKKSPYECLTSIDVDDILKKLDETNSNA